MVAGYANQESKTQLGNTSIAAAPFRYAIQLHEVVKTFKTPAGEFQALKGVNAGILEGDFVSVIGKSGSGKSTLLNMITGVDKPTTGQVVIGGVDIYRMNESKRALWRGKNLGIVFQFFQLLPMLTILENTILPMDYCDVVPMDQRPVRALDLLRMVGLERQAHKLPAALSSGQQQSAAIARALANDPPIIVADEPTGNLDTRAAEEVIGLFNQLVEAGKTIVIVTHDPSITESTKRMLIISDGELIDETVVQAMPLLTHPQMLHATHLLERFSFLPGQPILSRCQHVDYFYMIEAGEVEVVIQKPRCEEVVAANLGQGDFFGEIELLQGGNALAQVRANSQTPVSLVAIHRKPFYDILTGSPLTEEALTRIVQARLDENKRLQRRRC